MKEKLRTVICYKEKTPTIFNKGTSDEKIMDTFLAYYTYKTVEEAQKEVDFLNTTKPERLPIDGSLAHCDERTYFVSQ